MAFEAVAAGIDGLKNRGTYLKLKEKDAYKDLILMDVGAPYLKVKYTDGQSMPERFDPNNPEHVEMKNSSKHPRGYVQEHWVIKGYSVEDNSVYLLDGNYKLTTPLFALVKKEELDLESYAPVLRVVRSGVARATAFQWLAIRAASAEEKEAVRRAAAPVVDDSAALINDETPQDTPF